uniref:Uncharacterized protein n=1 Tax=Anguilla anguilla TaxID=7936 RepID=A0A0E9RJR7_ANGAN
MNCVISPLSFFFLNYCYIIRIIIICIMRPELGGVDRTGG